MCNLMFFPAGVGADESIIAGMINAGQSNPHGYGWAIVTPDGILQHKTMDLTEWVETFALNRSRYPHGPALAHSRWATHGAIDVAHCHPFNVGQTPGLANNLDPGTVFAHNGILSGKCLPLPGDDRSDSGKFAGSILPKIGHLDDPATSDAIHRIFGSFNKGVVLTVNPKYSRQAYLYNEGAGVWIGDPWVSVWSSNLDHLPVTAGKSRHLTWEEWSEWGDSAGSSRYGNGNWWNDDEPTPGSIKSYALADASRTHALADECIVCPVVQTESMRTVGICGGCYSCQECGGYTNGVPGHGTPWECDCFTPSTVRTLAQAFLSTPRGELVPVDSD